MPKLKPGEILSCWHCGAALIRIRKTVRSSEKISEFPTKAEYMDGRPIQDHDMPTFPCPECGAAFRTVDVVQRLFHVRESRKCPRRA